MTQTNPTGDVTYTAYTAGGMFSQDELAMNVYLKEAVWRLSAGQFVLVLPQSKDEDDDDAADAPLDVYIRNKDLRYVMETDALLARFDGLELDAGTVAEFMMAKMLGKPTVILRSDTRRLSGQELDDPYNLMLRHWPRTVQVHIDSMTGYMERFETAKGAGGGGDLLAAELHAVQAGVDAMAEKVIEGLQAALAMPSPYPAEDQAKVYALARLAPGSGFDQMVGEEMLQAIIEGLRARGTL